MNSYERITIEERKGYLVVKANELIQKNRFELSLQEQKTIAFMCSMIKPIEAKNRAKGIDFQLEYDFSIRDYCKVCGIDYNNGKNYSDIKNILKKLADRSMWLDDGNGEVLVRWLAKVRTNKRSGTARIELDRDLIPYLFDLGQRFTQYQLHNILAMKSAFSVRIYELMKSYLFQKSKVFDIDELKYLLMVENVKSYVNYKDFRIHVLEKAQNEINELTDINILIEPVFKGRKVVKVKFIIKEKNSMQRVLSIAKTNEILSNKKKALN